MPAPLTCRPWKRYKVVNILSEPYHMYHQKYLWLRVNLIDRERFVSLAGAASRLPQHCCKQILQNPKDLFWFMVYRNASVAQCASGRPGRRTQLSACTIRRKDVDFCPLRLFIFVGFIHLLQIFAFRRNCWPVMETMFTSKAHASIHTDFHRSWKGALNTLKEVSIFCNAQRFLWWITVTVHDG